MLLSLFKYLLCNSINNCFALEGLNWHSSSVLADLFSFIHIVGAHSSRRIGAWCNVFHVNIHALLSKKGWLGLT